MNILHQCIDGEVSAGYIFSHICGELDFIRSPRVRVSPIHTEGSDFRLSAFEFDQANSELLPHQLGVGEQLGNLIRCGRSGDVYVLTGAAQDTIPNAPTCKVGLAYPPPAIAATDPVIALTSETFTAEEIQFLESVLWTWEETSAVSRPFENSDPNADGYDPALALLTTVRAKLAALKPAVAS